MAGRSEEGIATPRAPRVRPRRRTLPCRASLLLAVAGSAALLTGPPAAATEYRVDHDRSELVVRVFKAGVGSAFAHDHVVRAQRYSAKLSVDRELVAVSAEIVVDARALEVDTPELRAAYGLDRDVSAEDRRRIRETMLGPGQLDVARHPEIRFRTSEVDRHGEDGLRVAGDLTLHGRTQRVTFPVEVADRDGELRVRGSFRFRQSDFGIEPYSALLGAVRNQDEVELAFELVAIPAGGATPRGLP